MTPLPQTTHADTALALAQGSNMAQKSWILVGAQQAGASEKKMAEIAQLPQRTVRRILSNFARTGVPSIPMQTSRKVKDMPIVEYDDQGNVTNYDENKAPSAIDRSRRKPTAKELISYVMAQNEKEKQRKQEQAQRQKEHVKPTHPPATAAQPFLLMTPPQEADTMHHNRDVSPITMIAPLERGKRSPSLPPSPPLQPASFKNDPSVTKSSLPQPAKQRSPTRHYEPWTREDDHILLKHVFSHINDANWAEVGFKLQGRHSAEVCRVRWKKLQTALLQDLD